MPYKTLKSESVIATIDTLVLRIAERFPDAGLKLVAVQLAATARHCAAEAERLARPQRWIRAAVYGVWALGAVAAAFVARGLHYDDLDMRATDFVQILEPAMNIAILVGIGVITLGRMETRYKRARALDALHELRSIAHVVDMHQLTKDPHRESESLPETAHSPKQTLRGLLLERYLDYCSELVSLTAKIAVLLAQSVRDGEVAEAASDIETLTTGLSRKIWQKIAIMPRTD